MQRDATALVDSVVALSYWMRGAITYDQLMEKTPGERDRIATFIEKRLEQESKKKGGFVVY